MRFVNENLILTRVPLHPMSECFKEFAGVLAHCRSPNLGNGLSKLIFEEVISGRHRIFIVLRLLRLRRLLLASQRRLRPFLILLPDGLLIFVEKILGPKIALIVLFGE